jgi:hypothetical protein
MRIKKALNSRRHNFVRRPLLGVLLAPALIAGCIEFESTVQPDPSATLPERDAGDVRGPVAVPEGEGIGGDCDIDDDCRPGLTCDDGSCVADGNTEPGGRCTVSAECAEGQCINAECVPAGAGVAGDSCETSAECGAGLRCGVVGLSPVCQPEGAGDALTECTVNADCMSSLICNEGLCVPSPNGLPAVPPQWEGVECEKPSENEVRAFFEVPGAAGADEGDYFRLPFPNDVRTDSQGRVNLSGFPTPGPNPIAGVDPLKLYVDAVDGTEGWGTNPTVVFRFSGRIDFESFNNTQAVHWLDITDPADPINAGTSYRTYSGDTKYVCSNHFTIRRPDGAPLTPGHVYAVWLGTDGRADDGSAIERSPNFEAMLENAVPGDSALADAHEKFQPFREYLEQHPEFDVDDVLVGTVFTVGPVRDLMSELADAVRDEPVPTATDWVLCGSGDDSPCAQAEDSRACGEGTADYDEYHALVELPIFQEGDPPYISEGGGIRTSGAVRTEPICMSLTVPKGDMPEAGWPLVVFGHGTGGSFRSHVSPTVAGPLSLISGLPDAPELPAPVVDADAGADAGIPQVPVVDNGPVRFAVLGYDSVVHGTRRWDSEEHPNHLFFNFLNPDAAQGNPLQGAADIIAIARMASELDVPASETGGADIRIDPSRLVFFGHSQGSIHGNLALPYAPEYKAAVLSGNGVSLMHALLSKTAPENIAAVVPFVLGDVDENFLLTGGDHHPALSVVQQHIDPADGLNFASFVHTPVEGTPAKHIFQTYGLDDHYSPPLTMRIYALAARLTQVEADSSADPADTVVGSSVEPPLMSSFAIDGIDYTTGIRQYGAPSGIDGHFVAFAVETANADVTRFLGMAARGQTPQIGE